MNPIAWLFLAGAIVAEVAGTLSLRMAVKSRAIWYLVVVLGYVVAFTLMTFALANGMPLGVAYGIWTAVGVALTAVLSKLLFREPFTWIMALGISLIVGGVLMIEVGSSH